MSTAAEKTAAAVLLFFLMRMSFVAIGSVVAGEPQVAPAWLTTSLDARLPVVPAAVWPYLSWYPATLLFLLLPQRRFRHSAVAIALAYTLCAVGYLMWPVSIVRPVPAGDTLSERVLLHLYANDPPWNIFPSFHAALCAIMCAVRLNNRNLQPVLTLWMASICISCVLTKQHYILDVVAGLAVGMGAFRLVGASDSPFSVPLPGARVSASVRRDARRTHE